MGLSHGIDIKSFAQLLLLRLPGDVARCGGSAGFAPTARIHRNWAPLALLGLLLLQLKSFLVLKLVGDKDH